MQNRGKTRFCAKIVKTVLKLTFVYYRARALAEQTGRNGC